MISDIETKSDNVAREQLDDNHDLDALVEQHRDIHAVLQEFDNINHLR